MFPLPLVVGLGDSPLLRAFLAGMHGLALVSRWLASLPLAFQDGGSVLLLLSVWHHRKPARAVTLRCHLDGKLERRQNSGAQTDWQIMVLLGPLIRLPGLILLSFQLPNTKRMSYLCIAADALPQEDFRRLRVWVKWQSDRVPDVIDI